MSASNTTYTLAATSGTSGFINWAAEARECARYAQEAREWALKEPKRALAHWAAAARWEKRARQAAKRIGA